MPTWTDQDGVVHAVDLRGGQTRLWCKMPASIRQTRALEKGWQVEAIAGDFRPHELSPVTCFGCLSEQVPESTIPEFVVCDACGAWWREIADRLALVDKAWVGSLPEYRVVQAGTLPRCGACP